MWFALKPPSPRKTYGFYRFEILAALFNGVTLFIIAGFIVWEAVERFLEPPRVAGEAWWPSPPSAFWLIWPAPGSSCGKGT